ncbi:hypothetical protein FRC11_008950 [Ceratobasidium sp. 423]|nr:hypothetical protein FRC11_008950 [Ceratobasidium sp. 423]
MSTLGKRSSPRDMASQSHDSDEELGVTSGSTRSLSRNAQAQARLRARRKAYVETLEANVKRLQTIVDAIALNPNRAQAAASAGASSPNLLPPFGGSPETPSLDLAVASQPPEALVHQLQADNARLRRERDALQVQIDALIGYISRGYALPSDSTGDTRATGPGVDHGLSPNPGSDAEIDSRAPIAGSPLIQNSAYNQDELNQLLSFDDSQLAFMRYLNLHAAGSAGLQIPHSNTSSESSPATFESLSTTGVQAEPAGNFIQGMHNNSGPNLMFRGVEP